MRSKGTKCDWIAQEQNKTEFLFSYSNKLQVDKSTIASDVKD